MLKPTKITIEYEGGAKVELGGEKAEAYRFLNWLYQLTIPRYDNGNNLNKALVSMDARIVLPDGKSRAFNDSDSVL